MAKQPAGNSPTGTARVPTKTTLPSTSGNTQTETALMGKTNKTGATDADALLKEDHRKVEKLFQEYESATDQHEKKELSNQICKELIVHTELEEKLFYPACRACGVEDDMLDEAQVEHDGAKVLITQLLTLSVDSDYYDAKVTVLSEYIKHHVSEEEKSSDGIFAKARNAGVDMAALGKQLQTYKEAALARGDEEILCPPTPRSLVVPDFINRSTKENHSMPNQQYRDDRGRFTQDDDRSSSGRQYASDDRYDSSRSRGRSASQADDRNRDEFGRFASDNRNDDRGYSDRYRQDSYDRSGGGRSGRDYSDYDDNRQGRGQGWYGDSEGHSQAARQGYGNYRDDRDDNRSQGDRDYRYSGRSANEDDRGDYRSSSSQGGRGGQGHGGWFGDPEGHSEAARRGYRSSGRSAGEDDRDDYRSSGNQAGRGSQGHGGWFGDSRGHAEAARRGWENR